jgi:uncharacterized protein
VDAPEARVDTKVVDQVRRRPLAAAIYGAPIGTLGGLIGLGGAEFRLPVLKAAFGYSTHQAVALNLAVSLVTLVASVVIRARFTTGHALVVLAPVMAALVAGSTTGAWAGATYASRISAERLERLILVMLTGIGLALIGESVISFTGHGVPFGLAGRLPLAGLLGTAIGLISSLLGVAGGEVIIPTLVFVFGVDIKTAGTASALISLPTVMVGIVRYATKGAFRQRGHLSSLVVPMGGGSIVGALMGGLLVPFVSQALLKGVLGAILIASAVRIFRHQAPKSPRCVVKTS